MCLDFDQVINSEAEDSDDATDDVTDGGDEEEEEEDEDDDDEETPISGPFSTLTARPPMDIEELARLIDLHQTFFLLPYLALTLVRR